MRRQSPIRISHLVQYLLLLCLGSLVMSCRSPQRRVAERMDTLRVEWQTNVAHQSNLPEQSIDWPAAVQHLLDNNLKLRQSRTEVTNTHEAVRQIFRDLTPTLNLRAGISKELKNIANTTVDDVTFSADSFFNIPGLVSFGARLYTARLYQLRAEAAYELIKREQIIDLYKVFLAAQDSQLAAEHLARERSTAEAFMNVEPFTGRLMMTETELQGLANKRETETLQQRAGDLLGSRASHWVFLTNGLPDLRYDREPVPLDDTNRVAQLQMKLVAIELEAARAQLTGIKLRYWPELNIFVSGPPIYQRAFGTDQFWKAEDLRASADLFWYVDTRGYVARQLRQAKRQQEIQRQRIHQETTALIDRLLNTQALLQTTLEKAQQVERHLAVLQAVPPVQNYASLYKYADDYRVLVDQQRHLRRELAELQTLFWFVDEDAWRNLEEIGSLADAR